MKTYKIIPREEQEKIPVSNIAEIISTSKSLEEMDERILKARVDEMLARSFSYKPRNKKESVKTISKDNIIKKGRKMTDFEE